MEFAFRPRARERDLTHHWEKKRVWSSIDSSWCGIPRSVPAPNVDTRRTHHDVRWRFVRPVHAEGGNYYDHLLVSEFKELRQLTKETMEYVEGEKKQIILRVLRRTNTMNVEQQNSICQHACCFIHTASRPQHPPKAKEIEEEKKIVCSACAYSIHSVSLLSSRVVISRRRRYYHMREKLFLCAAFICSLLPVSYDVRQNEVPRYE